ncbi:hypothetical protein L195_g048421 [Trifolium pratense]|uniref:Uncharacterized protein n=1 Tax=Trifolium pratense TaxID=57577 RepID=A0A2K3JL87_TRIPR|nr:hypothetical protein L195_g048421 [Trifolium pratense]
MSSCTLLLRADFNNIVITTLHYRLRSTRQLAKLHSLFYFQQQPALSGEVTYNKSGCWQNPAKRLQERPNPFPVPLIPLIIMKHQFFTLIPAFK